MLPPLPPVLPPRSKLFLITEEIVLKAARTAVFANVLYLNLHGNNIRKLENLSACVNLRVLILSFNEIHKVCNRAKG